MCCYFVGPKVLLSVACIRRRCYYLTSCRHCSSVFHQFLHPLDQYGMPPKPDVHHLSCRVWSSNGTVDFWFDSLLFPAEACCCRCAPCSFISPRFVRHFCSISCRPLGKWPQGPQGSCLDGGWIDCAQPTRPQQKHSASIAPSPVTTAQSHDTAHNYLGPTEGP